MDVAYGKRSWVKIFFRKFFHKSFRAFQVLLRKIKKRDFERNESLLIYPKFSSSDRAVDILNRVSWAIGQYDIKVDYLVKDSLDVNSSLDGQRLYFSQDDTRFSQIGLSSFSDYRCILVQKWREILNPKLWFHLDKITIIDPMYFSTTESDVWKELLFHLLTNKEQDEFARISKKNFINFCKISRGKEKAYCFATGPSFDRFDEFTYEKDALKVICNSCVKNEEFLDYIGKPDLLCFADPVFHFGPSEYAASFRDHMVTALMKFQNCYLCVPYKTIPLILNNYDFLKERIIGIDPSSDRYFFPDEESMKVKGSSNILTLLMLPLASVFSDEINIIGADGREKGENYFWKHSKKAQLNDRMNDAFSVHPSFFRDRDYDDYYDEHCEFLRGLIEFGEKNGKRYYSLTPSYIDVLKSRLRK